MKESREYEDDHEIYIFKMYTTKGDNYFVNLAQIHDIIGDELWFSGETKCLCNIASNRMISLSWGANGPRNNNPQIPLKHHLFHHAHVLVIM